MLLEKRFDASLKFRKHTGEADGAVMMMLLCTLS